MLALLLRPCRHPVSFPKFPEIVLRAGAAAACALVLAAPAAAQGTEFAGLLLTGPEAVRLYRGGELVGDLAPGRIPPGVDLRSLSLEKTGADYVARLTFGGPFAQLSEFGGAPATHVAFVSLQPPDGPRMRVALQADGRGTVDRDEGGQFVQIGTFTPQIEGNDLVLPIPASVAFGPSWEVQPHVLLAAADGNGLHAHGPQVPAAALTGEFEGRNVPFSATGAIVEDGRPSFWKLGETMPAGTRPVGLRVEEREGGTVAVVTMDAPPEALATYDGRRVATQFVQLVLVPEVADQSALLIVRWDALTRAAQAYDPLFPTEKTPVDVTVAGKELAFDLGTLETAALVGGNDGAAVLAQVEIPENAGPVRGQATATSDQSGCPPGPFAFPVTAAIESGRFVLATEDGDRAVGRITAEGGARLESPGGRVYETDSVVGTRLRFVHEFMNCDFGLVVRLPRPLVEPVVERPPPRERIELPVGDKWRIGVVGKVLDRRELGLGNVGTFPTVGDLIDLVDDELGDGTGPPDGDGEDGFPLWLIILIGIIVVIIIGSGLWWFFRGPPRQRLIDPDELPHPGLGPGEGKPSEEFLPPGEGRVDEVMFRAPEPAVRGEGIIAKLAAESPSPVASVVVPAYLAAGTIAACLRGLERQDLAEPFEVIVVASAGDGTAEIVRRGFPSVRLLAAPGRLSPGGARNAGTGSARGPVIAFLAADCVPDESWLRRRVEAHRAGHRLVGGFIDAHDPSTLAGWAQYFAKFGGLQHLARASFTSNGPLFHLSYSRDVLDRFGAFPEGTVAGEDTAYNHELVAAGERVHYDSAILVRHVNARRWTEVRDAQREQGLHAGATCRGTELARYFRHWIAGGPLVSLRFSLSSFMTVARHRPALVPRFLLALPLVVAAHGVRRRAFRAAFSGVLVPERVADARVGEVAPALGPPLVSVIVAAYDEQRLIGRCLDSLLAQSCERLEIIVADDGSTDGTAEIAAARGAHVLRLPHRGPARARNAGALAARGDVLVFVDADHELERGCLERLAAPILARRAVGTFTKEMWAANQTAPWAACWTLNRGFPPGHVFPPGFPDVWENFRAVDRAAFLAVGGYSDVGYGEDMTLAPKLGALAVAVPGAVIWHHNPSSLREIWENARWIGRGTRIRELGPRPWRRYLPFGSLRRGLRIARAAGRPRFLLFKLVYDSGVLLGYVSSQLVPARHWK